MKNNNTEIAFIRKTNPLINKLHEDIHEISHMIENAFTDLDISPYITLSEAREYLKKLLNRYNLIIEELTENYIQEVIKESAPEKDDDITDIYFSLAFIYTSLDDIIFLTSIPLVKLNEEAYNNLLNISESINSMVWFTNDETHGFIYDDDEDEECTDNTSITDDEIGEVFDYEE